MRLARDAQGARSQVPGRVKSSIDAGPLIEEEAGPGWIGAENDIDAVGDPTALAHEHHLDREPATRVGVRLPSDDVVGYAVVTLSLAVTFGGAILVFQVVLAPLTGGNTVAVAASTLVVAALFQPLRQRVQAVVDRRFNRARYDAERTVAAFTSQLRDEVDLGNLSGDVLLVVAQTVAPATVGLWLREPAPRAP